MTKSGRLKMMKIFKATMFATVFAVFFAAQPVQALEQVTADPATGVITVQTRRYDARFEGGTLVYLHNHLKKLTMIDVALDPDLPVMQRTALYVADQPKADPYWIYPATEGDGRAAVTVAEQRRHSVAVTFKGLVAAPQGKEQRRFPGAELTVTVSVEPETGHLLVKVSGKSPDTLLVGSSYAYAGLMTRSYNYSTAVSGVRQLIDLKNKRGRYNGCLEWSNTNCGKRKGLAGWLWPAPVTVQAAVDDPTASFSVWAEDDAPRSKYLIERGKGNAYVTYEMPPYDQNHQAESVVWRANVFDGGWTAAATPFADSLKRRGHADGRASWRNDISMIIWAPGCETNWLEAYKATFPPEVRHRVLIWLAQNWRSLTNTKDPTTKDAYYWDNSFSEQTAADIRAATAAGFRVSGYTNPHYAWGAVDQVIDPAVREVYKGFKGVPMLCPVAQERIDQCACSLAYTPYREHMLRTYKHVYDSMDMSLWMDTMNLVPLDGRGRAVDGMSSYEGALKFFRGARALKREQLIGIEQLTELAVMGGCADYAYIHGLHWSKGWEKARAEQSHPIVNYLFRETSIQVPQMVNVSYQPRYYHLNEEICERIGTIAAVEWNEWQNTSPEGRMDTPEKRHWFAKSQLYVRRGLRPQYPEKWEDGVMSYLGAADGAIFKFIETDYGSKLVEFPRRGKPVLHCARAWKVSRVPAEAGQVPDWIGVADNGDSIGLDIKGRGGYALLPKPATAAAHLRLNALPENLAIIAAKVEPDLAVVELGPQDRKLTKIDVAPHGAVEGTAGKPVTPIAGTVGLVTDRPLVRIASLHQPAPVLKPLGQRDGRYCYEITGEFWGEIAFLWRKGVYAPFEPTDDYLLPVNSLPSADPGEFFTVLQPFDQRWNAEISGPHNPRPGTVCQVAATALKTDDKPGDLTLFLTNPGKGGMVFSGTFSARVNGNEPQTVVFAGVRQAKMDPANFRALALRSFPTKEKNVRLTQIEPVRFIRPLLKISDTAPFAFKQVAKGATAVSAERGITNGQAAVATIDGKTIPTVLYGAAHVTAADAKRPEFQENDCTGVILVGKNAGMFRLKGAHLGPAGGLLLAGDDGQSGLLGGERPETETFALEFLGAPEPGEYTATVRIVTQAGNLGVCSTGKDGEPLAGLFYVDIPVTAQVQP